MKRSVSILLVLLLAVAMLLSGCGGSGGSAEESAASDNAQSDEAASADQEKAEAATEGMGDLLSSTYVDMMKGDEYLMKYKATMEFDGQSTEMEATIAESGDKMSMISTGGGYTSKMVIKDGKTYMIDDASKTVTSMATPPDEGMAENSGEIDTSGITYLGTGNEDGLVYEEYTTDAGGLKYYFDGKDLVRIKMTTEQGEMVMDIEELSNDVPASMFDIPSDYQIISM